MKIFVYKRSEHGVKHLIEEYDNPNDFARKYWESKVLAEFGDNDFDRKTFNRPWFVRLSGAFGTYPVKEYAKVAYTEKETIIPVSQLVGWARTRSFPMSHYGNGRRKRVYGGYRHPRTTSEMRLNEAANDDEFVVKIRAKRNNANLPNAWDDKHAGAQKSWKRQSKRQKQYHS